MAMLLPLLLVFPVVEMYLLIKVGGYLGAWPTIGLVVLAAAAGVLVLRRQGPAVLSRVVSRMQAGVVPVEELAEGALLAAAGVMLLMPGFVTDIAALVLLVPTSRRAMAAWLLARRPRPDSARQAHSVVIEGEFERRPAEDAPVKLRDRP